MILKAFHFLGVIIRYLWCQVLLLMGRYDRKYCKGDRYWKGIYAEGWSWLFHDWWSCLVTGSNSSVPWPISSSNTVIGWKNIEFDPEDLHNFQGKGCYFQAVAKITIGKGTYIANNVGIITANHDVHDLRTHTEGIPVTIKNNCWIGMNCVILPGVQLGDNTIVGAGSIVTHSFPIGNCIIVGNPAKIIKEIK